MYFFQCSSTVVPLGSSLLSSIYNTQLLSLISNYYYITGTLTLGKLRVHECAPLHVNVNSDSDAFNVLHDKTDPYINIIFILILRYISSNHPFTVPSQQHRGFRYPGETQDTVLGSKIHSIAQRLCWTKKCKQHQSRVYQYFAWSKNPCRTHVWCQYHKSKDT